MTEIALTPAGKRGRPPTGTAKTGAERQEVYRKRQAAKYVQLNILRDDANAVKDWLTQARDSDELDALGLALDAATLERVLDQLDKAIKRPPKK